MSQRPSHIRLDEFVINPDQADSLQNRAADIDRNRVALAGVIAHENIVSQAWFISPDERQVFCLNESSSGHPEPGGLLMNEDWNPPKLSREIPLDYHLLNPKRVPEWQIQLARMPIGRGNGEVWQEVVSTVECRRGEVLETIIDEGVVTEASFSSGDERFLALSAADMKEVFRVFGESLKTGKHPVDRDLLNLFDSCLSLEKSQKMRQLLHITSRV